MSRTLGSVANAMVFRARIWAVSGLLSCTAVAGQLSERQALTTDRVLRGGPPQYTTEFLLADLVPTPTRRFTNFSGDLSGRYIGALAASGHAEALRAFLPQVLTLQKPDGHFGAPVRLEDPSEETMALLWGQGRLLIGLLESYDADPNPAVLKAARRLGDFLVAAAPKLNSPEVRTRARDWWIAQGYICWTQNLEGVVALWGRTGDERYLRLAEQLAERVEQLPGMHSHGLLTSIRGVVALSQATGEPRWLRAAEAAWSRLADSRDLWTHGSIPEALHPGSSRDEGCSIADWVRLNLDLWQATTNPKYLQHAEFAAFNAFFGNQFPSGDFGHIALRPDGFGYETARAWWCCTLHGMRTFPAIRRSVFRQAEGLVHYDLPLDGEIQGKGWSIEAKSALDTEGRITIESEGQPPPLHIRQPDWAKLLTIAGKPLPNQLQLGRERSRAVLKYEFDYKELRDETRPGEVAIVHGPWLLSVAEADDSAFFDEPAEHNRVHLPSERASGDTGAFRVPVAARRLRYQPAGYPEQLQQVTLRPVSEFAAVQGPARRQIWLRTAGEGGSVARALARIPGRAASWWAWLAALAVAAIAGYWAGRRRVSR